MAQDYDGFVGALQHLSREFRRAAAARSGRGELLVRYAALLDQMALDLMFEAEAAEDSSL
ncbi:MAG: hypothetical protein ACE5Q3_17375 [Alphaproteobacteria bacterium]